MSPRIFNLRCAADLPGIRALFDRDYGSPTDHALDPRNEDPRGFDDLNPSEQRQIIETGLEDGTMTQADVVDQLMMALDDARILRMRCGALEAGRKV